jgi:uncharacterized protein (UPF0332 family)
MMSEQRIREAKTNTATYLAEGLLIRTTQTHLPVLMKNSRSSLQAAKLLLEHNIPFWTIVTSYYAMFYAAQATLRAQGYKVGDKIVHKVVADALITFIKPKLTAKIVEDYEKAAQEAMRIAELRGDEIISYFDYERNKRSFIQYHTTHEDVRSKAVTSLQRAKEFVFEMEGLLE